MHFIAMFNIGNVFLYERLRFTIHLFEDFDEALNARV